VRRLVGNCCGSTEWHDYLYPMYSPSPPSVSGPICGSQRCRVVVGREGIRHRHVQYCRWIFLARVACCVLSFGGRARSAIGLTGRCDRVEGCVRSRGVWMVGCFVVRGMIFFSGSWEGGSSSRRWQTKQKSKQIGELLWARVPRCHAPSTLGFATIGGESPGQNNEK
jgi:hypothetical protein